MFIVVLVAVLRELRGGLESCDFIDYALELGDEFGAGARQESHTIASLVLALF